MGGSQESYERLEKCAQENARGWWSCLKDTKDGDLLLFYFKDPRRAIVASATVSGGAKPGKSKGYDYIVWFNNVKLFEKELTLMELRKAIPEWGWLKRTRKETYPNEPVANKLLKILNLDREESPEKIISSSGAGFGTADQNRIVEKAACKAVRLHFKNEGFEINSREKENLGYDFDAKRDQEELHIEVKGISGVVTKFVITAGEVKCARTDSRFRVAAVTEATTPRRKIKIFTGTEFLKKFTLRPLAYSVEMKRNLLA